jgi:hypothetical protein
MKYNLLKMTQLILSAMDSDEVNDIGDTTESQQVVDIIETVFNEFASEFSFPEQHSLFQMEATTTTTPTILTRPDNVVDVDWFRYNHQLTAENNTDYFELVPVSLTEFIRRMDGYDVDQSNVQQMTFTTDEGQAFTFTIRNDLMPNYFCIVGDKYIICDAFMSSEETNLQKSNTMCFGKLEPTFTRSNTFVPQLDESVFSAFFNECKSQCINDLKQTLNQKTELKARRGQIRLKKNRYDVTVTPGYKDTSPNFGRK